LLDSLLQETEINTICGETTDLYKNKNSE